MNAKQDSAGQISKWFQAPEVTAIQGIGIKYNQTRISIGQEYASQATRTRTYFHHPHCSIPLLVDLLIEGTSGGSACAGNAC